MQRASQKLPSDSTATCQVRGTAPKPKATITAPGATGSATYYETTTPANPTQSGTISQCGAYYLVEPGDDCFTVTRRFHIAAGTLRDWNTYVAETCTGTQFGAC
jgi:hypothetical protein